MPARYYYLLPGPPIISASTLRVLYAEGYFNVYSVLFISHLLSTLASSSASSRVSTSLGSVTLAPSRSSLAKLSVDLGERLLASVLLVVGGFADERLA